MKLKGLGNRAYNIFFHTHTVSGIVISTALYIIFFAGAFTLFRAEVHSWESPAFRKKVLTEVRPEKILEAIYKVKPEFDINEDTYITFPSDHDTMIRISGHLSPDKDGKERHFYGMMHPQNLTWYDKAPSTISDTLYRLHFLDQLPYAGRWIAGFVSLFFIFATLTGLLIHWKNIFTKFWAFSFKGSWKQIWTNSHTVFGLLGLPFQLMYAVTGAFYLLLALVLLPAVMVFYGGKVDKVYALAYPSMSLSYDEHAPAADNSEYIAGIYHNILKKYGHEYEVLRIQTRNVMKTDGAINVILKSRNEKLFSVYGYTGYRLSDGKELYSSIPGVNKTYTHSVVEALGQLHFASFGGISLRFLYFVMSLFTCFVIISGILLWKEARNNKHYTEKQKRFHHRVTLWYLAICFGLFPAVPVLFDAELIIPAGLQGHTDKVNLAFFSSWLLFIISGILFRNEARMTKYYLLCGGVLSLSVPIVNGLVTGDWVWKSLSGGHPAVAGVDVFWLITGTLCLIIGGKMKPAKNKEMIMTEEVHLSGV